VLLAKSCRFATAISAMWQLPWQMAELFESVAKYGSKILIILNFWYDLWQISVILLICYPFFVV
jgi:hypothetical protein